MTRFLVLVLFCCFLTSLWGQKIKYRSDYNYSLQYQKIYEDDNVVEYIIPNEYFDTTFPKRHFPPYPALLGPIPATSETGVLDGVYLEEYFVKIESFDQNHIPNRAIEPKDSLFLELIPLVTYYDDDSIKIENLSPDFSVHPPDKINQFSRNFDTLLPVGKKLKFYDNKLNLMRVLRLTDDGYHEIKYENDSLVKESRLFNNTYTVKEKINFWSYYHLPLHSFYGEWKISTYTDSSVIVKHYDQDFKLISLYINRSADHKALTYIFDTDGEILAKKVRYHNSKITVETYDRYYTLLCYEDGRIKSLEITDLKTGQSNYLHWSPLNEGNEIQRRRMKIDKVVIKGKEVK